jgi:pentapeptide MXKDX repeat protein
MPFERTGFKRKGPSMTISTRSVLGISAAALWLGLALAPAAFAQDPMSQDIDFRNGLSRDVGVKQDTMAKATVSKDPTRKDDGIKKYRRAEVGRRYSVPPP